MVRLSKLNNKQQASWGPHSLSASIDKQKLKDAVLPDFPAKSTIILSPRQYKKKATGKLPALLPSKEQKARQSPYISHMIRRDREHLLHKLGSVKAVEGNYKYENILSTMLHDLSPIHGAPNLTLTALMKAGSMGNIKAPLSRSSRRSKAPSLDGSVDSQESSSSLGGGNVLTEYSWWRESDQDNFNYNPSNPNPFQQSNSFYTSDELGDGGSFQGVFQGPPVSGGAGMSQAEMDSNNQAMVFDPPAPAQEPHISLVDAEDDDDLISTASDAESLHLEDELLSSRECESDADGEICLDTDADAEPTPVKEVVADPDTNPDSAFIATELSLASPGNPLNRPLNISFADEQ
jgi:hypothetical protein